MSNTAQMLDAGHAVLWYPRSGRRIWVCPCIDAPSATLHIIIVTQPRTNRGEGPSAPGGGGGGPTGNAAAAAAIAIAKAIFRFVASAAAWAA